MLKCFACGRKLPASPYFCNTADGQKELRVGPDCWRRIKASGNNGYQPPKGGPRLYLPGNEPKETK